MVLGANEAARRHSLRRWKFADGHGDLVAGFAPGTVHAVFRHLVAEDPVFGDAEVEVFEEGGDAREEADALDAAGFGLIEEGLYEQASGSVSLGAGMDDDGANLRKVRAVDVERGATDELVQVVFHDGEGFDVLADLRVTPGKQGAVVSEAVDELVDGAGVLQLRFARSHRDCGDLVFRWEGDCE